MGDAAGYAEWAERHTVVTGPRGGVVSIVDSDGGSTPARGATAAAWINPAGYYDCSSGDPDEDVSPYDTKAAAEAHLRVAAWQRPGGPRDAGTCIEALQVQLATLAGRIAAMDDRLRDLELQNVAHLGGAQAQGGAQ
jgi:hypothetical protein